MELPISILDQSPIPEGLGGAGALRNSVDLARLADELGYHRYWVAEHHGTPGLASASPEALIGPIAAATEKIRSPRRSPLSRGSFPGASTSGSAVRREPIR
jgi:hypothetical protein